MTEDKEKITILTSRTVRGETAATIKQLDVDILASNVNLFLIQMEKIMTKTPQTVGEFQFVEFEIHADISAEGQLILLGTGGKAGVQGGLSFKFQKVQVPVEKAKKK